MLFSERFPLLKFLFIFKFHAFTIIIYQALCSIFVSAVCIGLFVVLNGFFSGLFLHPILVHREYHNKSRNKIGRNLSLNIPTDSGNHLADNRFLIFYRNYSSIFFLLLVKIQGFIVILFYMLSKIIQITQIG